MSRLAQYPEPFAPRIVRCVLREDLYACDEASAELLWYPINVSDGMGGEQLAEPFADGAITVFDALGRVNFDYAAQQDAGGNWFIPAGYWADVYQKSDSGNYEPLGFGACVQAGSGSGASAIEPPEPDSGYKCRPGKIAKWVTIEIDGVECEMQVCCPLTSGSSGGSAGCTGYALFGASNYLQSATNFMPTGTDPFYAAFEFRAPNTGVALLSWGAGEYLGISIQDNPFGSLVTAAGVLGINVSATGAIACSTTTNLADGATHAVVITFDGSSLAITIDGTPQSFASVGAPWWTGGAPHNGSGPTQVGVDTNDGLAGNATVVGNISLGSSSGAITASYSLQCEILDQTGANDLAWTGTPEFGGVL